MSHGFWTGLAISGLKYNLFRGNFLKSQVDIILKWNSKRQQGNKCCVYKSYTEIVKMSLTG